MGQHGGTPAGRCGTLTVAAGLALWEPGQAQISADPPSPPCSRRPPGHCQGLSKAVCVQSVPGAFGGGWQSSAPSGSGQGLNNKCCPDPDAPQSLCQHGVGVVDGGKGLCLCPLERGRTLEWAVPGVVEPCQARAPPRSQFSMAEGQPVGFGMCLTVPAPVLQVLAPSSCTRCTRGSGAFPWTPMTSQMLLYRCQGPPWLWESTSMQVMQGWEQDRGWGG